MSKNLKKSAKKNFNFFLFRRFYAGGKNFTNKKACFILNFLNLKSKAIHLFLGVASSLSILCTSNFETVQCLCTVGFWCQTIHKKFLRRFDTIFGLKMMVKSGLEKNILKYGHQNCCCPVQKNLPSKAELAWQVSRYL
jgi:hypothetical protein